MHTLRVFSQIFGVVGAIIEREGNVLLVREYHPGHPDHGKWSHPAGWIDVGEDPLTAVVREVKEETGYVFTPTALLGIYSLVRRDITDRVKPGTPHPIKLIFRGTISSEPENFDKDEISEIRWFTPEAVASMNSATLRDVDIKQMAQDYLAGASYPLTLLHHIVQAA